MSRLVRRFLVLCPLESTIALLSAVFFLQGQKAA